MLASDGALYGTASEGGSSDYGTVFKLNTNGTGFTVLKNYDYSTTGGYLYGTLIQGADGALYGTASNGGSSDGGTVFKLNTNGNGFTVLKNLSPASDLTADGGYPFAGLVQATDGALYGTTNGGGGSGDGTVFKLNPDGTGFTVLTNFDYSTTGGYPLRRVDPGNGRRALRHGVQGGSNGSGTVFKLNTDGTGFTVLETLRLCHDRRLPAGRADAGRGRRALRHGCQRRQQRLRHRVQAEHGRDRLHRPPELRLFQDRRLSPVWRAAAGDGRRALRHDAIMAAAAAAARVQAEHGRQRLHRPQELRLFHDRRLSLRPG